MKFALDKSIFTTLSKAIPQAKHRLDRESAVWMATRAEKYHFEMLGFKLWGFGRGSGLPPIVMRSLQEGAE